MGDHPLLLSPEKLAILQKTGDSDVQALVAEVLRLRDDWVRMRSALHVLDQWDQLNPPAPMSDLPWVRKVVDDGLGKAPPVGAPARPVCWHMCCEAGTRRCLECGVYVPHGAPVALVPSEDSTKPSA